MSNRMLYFAATWPRLQTSAACERVFGLIDTFNLAKQKIEFLCAAQKHKQEMQGVKRYTFVMSQSLDPNDYDAVDQYFGKNKGKIDFAMFDTFVAEEFFGHHLHRLRPDCMTILDTQDLHSLRKVREAKYMELLANDPLLERSSVLDVLKVMPSLEDPLHAREMASIFRSDLVLVTSDFEQLFLERRYGLKNVQKSQFYYGSDLFDKNDTGYRNVFYDGDKEPRDRRFNYEKRKDFVWIGSFKHPPNTRAVELLLNSIWPKVRERLPTAELHIYGSDYPKQFENIEGNGVKKKNLMQDLMQLTRYRVLLAPIFFGAGIKGKVTDSWFNFLPVVTTPVGAEGLYLESIDNDFAIQRSTDNGQPTRFMKTEETTLRAQNDQLINYYKYDSPEAVKQSNFTFGGLYKALSNLISLR